jgi:hypothetical protein
MDRRVGSATDHPAAGAPQARHAGRGRGDRRDPPENPRTAADVPALNRPWNLALAMGLLRADGNTVIAGPGAATWPPAPTDILAAWLDGLLTISGSETGSPWDDTPAMDILVFLTAVQEAADGVPLSKQATELAERIRFGPAIFWPEKRIANTAERLASFGAIGGGEVTSLGRWAAARLRDQLAEPDEELTAAGGCGCRKSCHPMRPGHTRG